MTITQLASLIAKNEGKKSQASVGDIREILSILGEHFMFISLNEIDEIIHKIMMSGARRVDKKEKRKK